MKTPAFLLSRWLAVAACVLTAFSARAGTKELLWKNVTQVHDLGDQYLSADGVKGILSDGTVVFSGYLQTAPDNFFVTSGYFYLKSGGTPQPLGGTTYYTQVQQVIVGQDDKIAVVLWDKPGPNPGPCEIRTGTVSNLDTSVFSAGYVSSPSNLPQLRHFYGAGKLAFTNGARVYRWLGSTVEMIHGPERSPPNLQPSYPIYSGAYGLIHMAADGRAYVNSEFIHNTLRSGYGIWSVSAGTDATYTTVFLQAGGSVMGPADPVRPGNKLMAPSGSGTAAGLVGPVGYSVNSSQASQIPVFYTQTIGDAAPVLMKNPPNASGTTDFTWQDAQPFASGPQLTATGELLSQATAIFPPPGNAHKRMLAWFTGGVWQPVLTEGDTLPSLPAGVLVGSHFRATLENGNWMSLDAALAGTGVTDANKGALLIGKKDASSAAFDLVLRGGETFSLPGGVTGTLNLSPPVDDDVINPPNSPDSGTRHTMNADGTMARVLSFSTDNGTVNALYLLKPSPLAQAQTLAPTAHTASSLTVAGTVNPANAESTVTFEYGNAANALNKTIAAAPGTVNGEANVSVGTTINFLPSNTAMYYRVVVSSPGGTIKGNVVKATTDKAAATPPVATTTAAASITFTSATLNGTANARSAGVPAFTRFEWGLSATALLNSVDATPESATGTTAVTISGTVNGLLPHTKYYFRAVAAGNNGFGAGPVLSFTTGNHAPAGVTDTALALPGAPVTLLVTANDTDEDADALTVKSFTQPASAQGRVTKAPAGNALIFTPAATFSGGATFTYIAQDASGGVTAATTVTVNKDTIAIDPLASPAGLLAAPMTYPVTVDVGGASTPWTVVETSAFVTVTPTSGMGDGAVNILVAANTAKTARTATVTIGGQVHAITQPGVVPPVLVSPTVPPAIVSGTFSMAVQTSTPALPVPTYTTTPLPPGLKLVVNASTGAVAITGKPDKAGTFPVTVKASNAATTAATVGSTSFTIVVRDLPPHMVGDHIALVNGNAALDIGIGELVNFKTTASGSFTGSVKVGQLATAPETLPFSGRLDAVAVASPNPVPPATAHVLVARKAPLVPLEINLTLATAADAGDNIVTGTLQVQGSPGTSATLSGWRNTWTTAAPATVLRDAKNNPLPEYYTAGLTVPNGTSTANPLGVSYLTFTLQPAGTLTWSAAVADGVTVTGAGSLSPSSQLIVWAPLYQKAAGSYLGVLRGKPTIARPASTVGGTLQWAKVSQNAPGVAPAYSYLNGFNFNLTVAGARYAVPSGIVLGLSPASLNADIDFNQGGLGSAAQGAQLDQTFTISATNAATFVTANNPCKVALTINKTLGLFSGTFSLSDTLAAGVVKRTSIAYKGVLLPDTTTPANSRGKGFFNLPQLPASGTSTATTSRLSGSVEIRPH